MSGSEDRGPASFEEFVTARRPALLRTAYLLVGDRDAAEDLVQTALMSVVPRWSRIAARPEPYVRQVLVRASVTRWRARRWRELSVDRLPDRPGDTPDHDVHLALRDALSRLAPRQRAVIVLRYYEDLTEKESAAALGVSVGTVKSNARDALARLRVVLGEELVDALDG